MGVTKLDVSAELPISAAEMFVERDTAAFRSLLAKALNVVLMEVGRTWCDENTGVDYVELHTKPDTASYVPAKFKSLLTFDLLFIDIIAYDPAKTQGPSYTLSVDSKLPFLKERQYSIKTELSIVPLGPQRCCQSLTGTVEVKVLGVGAVVSQAVLSSLKDAYRVLPEVVERWVQFKQSAMASPEGRAALLEGLPDVKSFPKEFLEPFMAPYSEVTEASASSASSAFTEQEYPLPAVQVGPPKLTGQLRTDSSIYFDALDYCVVDDMDPATRDAVLQDLREVVAKADQPIELELAQDWDSGTENTPPTQQLSMRTAAGKPPGPTGRIRRESSFDPGYNERLSAWSKFWHQAGIATAKIPNPVSRSLGLVGGFDKLGLLKIKLPRHTRRHSAGTSSSAPSEANSEEQAAESVGGSSSGRPADKKKEGGLLKMRAGHTRRHSAGSMDSTPSESSGEGWSGDSRASSVSGSGAEVVDRKKGLVAHRITAMAHGVGGAGQRVASGVGKATGKVSGAILQTVGSVTSSFSKLGHPSAGELKAAEKSSAGLPKSAGPTPPTK